MPRWPETDRQSWSWQSKKELLTARDVELEQDSELTDLRQRLARAEQELVRLRDEAESKQHLVEIIHDVMGNLSSDEIFHVLVRRLARAMELTQSSVVLAKPGDRVGTVVCAFEQPALVSLTIDISRYPEIAAALEEQRPVLIRDIHTSAWYAELRKLWEAERIKVTARSIIALPFTLDDDRSGVFLLRRGADRPSFDDDDVEFARSVVGTSLRAVQRARIAERTIEDNARLEALAHTDPLTELLNRRALNARLLTELDRARRYGSPVALLMIDLDHFKRINDTFGHAAGDAVLAEFGRVLQRAARSVDIVARYGGEEFTYVLPETTLDGAAAFAERLRERIEAHQFHPTPAQRLRLTASIGIGVFPAHGVDGLESLLASADAALYRAKTEGRNRVCA